MFGGFGMRIKFTKGNQKLPKTTYILNMTSATDCPSRTMGLCPIVNDGGECYAKRPERFRPGCLPFREYQHEAWLGTSAESIAQQLLAASSRSKKHPMRALRFSEAGDFESQAGVDKMDMVAANLKPYGIVTCGYTARIDLDFSKVRHVVVTGSGFMVHNEFVAVKEFTAEHRNRCAGNCRVCVKCQKRYGETIFVKYH